jgi:hypothetical protein
MSPDSGEKSGAHDPRQDHRGKGLGWPIPSKLKTPPPRWNSKTLHHPATRIGEIKHGKA